jgi:hypothetical protein
MASPYVKTDDDQMSQIVVQMRANGMKELGLNWKCGICDSVDLRFEEGPTRFASIEEAMPHLRKIEEENILTRLLIDSARNAPDPQS